MPTPETWLDREGGPLPKVFEESDYPNHHIAIIRCLACDTLCEAVYPKDTNPRKIQCHRCGVKDSEVVKYGKFIYQQ